MSEFNEKDNIDNSAENDNFRFSEEENESQQPEDDFEELSFETKKSKTPRTVSLRSFWISTVALVLAAVMLTYTVCSTAYKSLIDEAYLGNASYGEKDSYDKLDLIRSLFERYSYFDINDEAKLDAVLRAYVAETGDRYAVYYNAEEYAAQMQSAAGNTVGIGVTVTESVITVDGVEYTVLDIFEVTEGGPADLAGVKSADKIAFIGEAGSEKLVGELGYNDAVGAIRGEEGTSAHFAVFREKADGYEKISFSVERKSLETPSVQSYISKSDASVGVVRITQFKYNTPKQFSEAVDGLLAKGCNRFVFDVRGNPGGSLDSVVAVLSYFLREGDTVLSTMDANGTTEVIKTREITNLEGELADCNVSAEDIGKYRDKIKKMSVVCDGSSASAAELFTANFRDHALGTVVGQKTYGKGSMQTVFSLLPYGYTGGLRLTTRMYFPPCGESYEGIGIYPDDGYDIALTEEALEYTLNTLPEELDSQLIGAISSLK